MTAKRIKFPSVPYQTTTDGRYANYEASSYAWIREPFLVTNFTTIAGRAETALLFHVICNGPRLDSNQRQVTCFAGSLWHQRSDLMSFQSSIVFLERAPCR